MPRWNWTWEDHEPPGRGPGERLPHPPEWISRGAGPAGVPRVAAFAAIAVVALIVQLVLFGGSHHAPRAGPPG